MRTVRWSHGAYRVLSYSFPYLALPLHTLGAIRTARTDRLYFALSIGVMILRPRQIRLGERQS
jgi:hypothetical protein